MTGDKTTPDYKQLLKIAGQMDAIDGQGVTGFNFTRTEMQRTGLSFSKVFQAAQRGMSQSDLQQLKEENETLEQANNMFVTSNRAYEYEDWRLQRHIRSLPIAPGEALYQAAMLLPIPATVATAAQFLSGEFLNGESSWATFLSTCAVNAGMVFFSDAIRQRSGTGFKIGAVLTAGCATAAGATIGAITDYVFNIPAEIGETTAGALTLPIMRLIDYCCSNNQDGLYNETKYLPLANGLLLGGLALGGACYGYNQYHNQQKSSAKPRQACEQRLNAEQTKTVFDLSADEMVTRENAKGRITIAWPGATAPALV